MCKVINLISSESYVRANSRYIKLTNLTIATYTEMLFTILDAVSKKKTFDQTTGVFTISREYIEERTVILAEDQKEADLDKKTYLLQLCLTNSFVNLQAVDLSLPPLLQDYHHKLTNILTILLSQVE